jgi:hypothetical protein
MSAISPAPFNLANLAEDDDRQSSLSFDLSSSDGAESPPPYLQPFNNQLPTTHTQPVGSSSFRRHSFTDTAAPTVRGQKTKCELSADQEHVVKNVRTMEGDSFPSAADGHLSKRRRYITKGTSAASAPALFPVPLPEVDDGGSTEEGNGKPHITLPPATSAAASASVFAAPPAPTSTQRRTRRRTGTGGGRTTRAKRTPCEFCGKTFSRVQDAQRHITTSCAASPEKAGVECPECNAVLSRLDAAQRHWRGHENPTSPRPAWMNRP